MKGAESSAQKTQKRSNISSFVKQANGLGRRRKSNDSLVKSGKKSTTKSASKKHNRSFGKDLKIETSPHVNESYLKKTMTFAEPE